MAEPLQDPRRITLALADWYRRAHRRLPWRAPPGTRPADPWAVALAEIMLQQTTVQAVTPRWQQLLQRFPTPQALADAPLAEVLAAWAGLGYYARARNLHALAQALVAEHDGRLPATEAALRRLPGLGAYTAASIAAIAFGQPAVVVDSNVERVMARLAAVEQPLPAARSRLRRLAALLSPGVPGAEVSAGEVDPGDHAQAMMDLGAGICTPRRPVCLLCPVAFACAGFASGKAESLPAKAPKPVRPTRRAVAFWLESPGGEVLLRTRPPTGLLGGMPELPSSPWEEQPMPALRDVLPHSPAETYLRLRPETVVHVFTHFRLELTLATGVLPRDFPLEPPWFTLPRARLPEAGLPTLMLKLVRLMLPDAADAGG